jgi:ribosomal-protein-alanine N-acetyltransferase
MIFSRLARRQEAPSILHDSVTLRPVLLSDYADWLDVVSADEARLRRVQPTWPAGHLTRIAYRRRAELFDRERARGTGYAWHVFADGRLIGACRLSSVKRGAAGSAELGYWIASMAEGRGHATAAVSGACAHAFEILGLERITANYLPDNAASARGLEKAGFTKEGLARSLLEIDGVRRDHVIAARLRSDAA